MRCEQSTMVLTDKTNNQSKMLAQNQSALPNFESLSLEQPQVDAFFLRQEKQDREENLKQFHPDLANVLIQDLMQAEASQGLLINPYKKRKPIITSEKRCKIL